MEDSFSDFKKTKKIKTGPKVDPKDKKNNKKKSLKRSKSQKDIRSLVKKNELVSYSQDFEEVCKQSGVDVDAEQLQLAIALSKSINEVQSYSEDVENKNKQLSSKERTAKIKTTLQEYGFKVNNTKILLSLSKTKRKKYNKHSKLLQISSEERQQKISNKYLQVLASNIYKSPNEDPKCIYLNQTIFYKATNIPYDVIKNDEKYYVSNLIDKPTHKTCLLRDWSEIPGRAVSPKQMHKDINFETIQYSQDELDNILSGSIDTAQSIVNSKQYITEDQSLIAPSKDDTFTKDYSIDLMTLTPTCSNNSKSNEVPQISVTHEITKVQVHAIQDSEKYSSIKDKENIEHDRLKDTSFKDCAQKSLKVIGSQNLNLRQFRSASPDLFDDEVCSIIEDKNNCSTLETDEVCSIIENKNTCSTIDTYEVCSIIENKNNCSTIDTNKVCSIIENENNCSTTETDKVCSIIDDKNNCSTIETNEVCSRIENKNICSTIETDEVCSIIENKNNCSTIDTDEVCSIIENRNNCSTIETDEVCSIIDDKNNCSTIEIDEVCSIIDVKNNCSTIETDEVCSIIDDKNNCSTIETDEVCSIIEDKNNCSTIEIDEVCSIIEDKNNCSTIDTNEVCSIIDDKNNCSTIETDEVCSIIEDKNNCSTIETDEVCSIIDDKNNGTRERININDNCGTIFMDLTECANNYSNLNIHNKDITKRKSNDLMDITECVKPKNNNSIDVIISSGEIVEDNKEDNVVLVDLTQVSNLVSYSPEIGKNCTEISDSFDTEDTDIYDNIVFESTLNESVDLQAPIVLCDEESIAKDKINNEKSSEHNNSNNSKHNSCKFDDDVINSPNFIENVENIEDDINIDLTQGSAHSEDLLDYPEYIFNDSRSVPLKHHSDDLTDNDKDNDTISLKSVAFDNHVENHDEDIDLTQDSEKSCDIAQENYDINCPGTSYNNSVLENFDYNVGTIDKNNIINVENIEVNSNIEENNADKIDLTQHTEEIQENIAKGNSYAHKNNSKLGKIDNISIDYDELFDEIISESRDVSKQFKNNSNENDVNGSNPSINSEIFEISDKELNYSIHHSIHEDIDLENIGRVGFNRSISDGYVQEFNSSKHLSPIKDKNNSHPNTPLKINRHVGDAIIQTPKNSEYIIKTREVTPMADYEAMTSPERNEELEKYGLKPFKRKRAIQLLTYVYNQTHPVIESCSPEGPAKRLKRDHKYSSPKKKSKSPKKCLDFGSDLNKENDIFLVTKETPDIKNIECDPKEWVFQNREKAKVHSCRVPLHIAFHNYVSCRKLLKEAILRYEPVNIDIIHRDLVSDGHRYNPKDLLKFMDRKCITVKTAENNSRNKKV